MFPKQWLFIIFAITIFALGTGNHFWYEISNSNEAVKWFAASDESVFSHLKLVLWPWLFCLLISFLLRNKLNIPINNYSSGVVGMYIYMAIVMLFFYMYTSGFGSAHNLGADISIFIIAIILGVTEWYVMSKHVIPITYDLLISICGIVGALVWIVTCSYHKCANIYDIPIE